jgi:hypothetical protein
VWCGMSIKEQYCMNVTEVTSNLRCQNAQVTLFSYSSDEKAAHSRQCSYKLWTISPFGTLSDYMVPSLLLTHEG